ncbi:MAG: helix-turn-helix domain-containing protein, partial [Chloroflexota bacterium]|nr:helix-turn-helix domain-containing protein [Chloroflexota bacterium]
PTRRLYVTSKGLDRLAWELGVDTEDVLDRYPVSAHWQRILLGRLDAVASIYQLVSTIADVMGPVGLRWYRNAPMDAAAILSDGRVVAIVRQGATSDRTGFSRRLWRLLEGAKPGAVLVLTPDEVRLRHGAKSFRRRGVPAFLALERHAVLSSSKAPIWDVPSLDNVVDLRTALASTRKKGMLVRERRLAQPAPPSAIRIPDEPLSVPDHLLPAVLKPAWKRVLDMLADWPWLTPKELGGMLGVSKGRVSQMTVPLAGARLVRRQEMEGRERLALTDWGWAVLARRDRTSIGGLRQQWSVAPDGDGGPLTWRAVSGRRSRLLARNMEHTEAVHGFMARLAAQAKEKGHRVEQLDPPHRASRHFRHRERYREGMRAVHPDAFGALGVGEAVKPFFLEWEHRAVRPGTMAARLAPYLRYYATREPVDDHGHGAEPVVLMVFDDAVVEARFLVVARREMARVRVRVPLFVSHRERLEQEGPLGAAWRVPGVLEPMCAFE